MIVVWISRRTSPVADEIPGFAETLDELRTRPGEWKRMVTVDEEPLAAATYVAFLQAAEQVAPDDPFGFGFGELDAGQWTVVGCFQPNGVAPEDLDADDVSGPTK